MTNELKAKLARKNQIVDFYQRGLLSEKEFEQFMWVEKVIDKLESKDMSIPNYFTEYQPPEETYADDIEDQQFKWGEEPI